MIKHKRGDIWLVTLDPTKGSEINKTRPAVVISRTDFNLLSRTVTIIPISSTRFIPGIHVSLANLKKPSQAIIPQIRIAAKERLHKKIGYASDMELREIEMQLKFYLGLHEMVSS